MQSNTVLRAGLSGTETVPDELIQIASCKNARDWIRDETLGDLIVLNTESSVIRAAELIASDRFDSHVVLAIEQRYWSGGNLVYDQSLADQKLDRGQVDAYITARAAPPSQAAKSRFVVYGTSITTDVQSVRYLDTMTLRASSWKRGTEATHQVVVTTPFGTSKNGVVSDAQCSDG